MDKEEYFRKEMEIRLSKIKPHYGKFSGHRQHAKSRGIEFCFSYEEWIKWWEDNLGPDWHKKRGYKRGQYVMGRNGDKGPYRADNVRCITSERNGLEVWINGGKEWKGTKGSGRSLNYVRNTLKKKYSTVFTTNIKGKKLVISKFGKNQVLDKCEMPLVEGIMEALEHSE